jgi:hypothetical protein
MNFLEKGHHAGRQKTNVILVGWPKLNWVESLLKVTNLHNGLRLADVEHLPHQHQSITMNIVAHYLIKEREFILVSKERLVGGGGDDS